MTKLNGKWNTLYRNYINKNFSDWDEYFNIKMKLKRKFIKQVLKYSVSGKPVLECGCGTGKTSILLSSYGITTYATDIEKEMVKETKKKSKEMYPENLVNVFEGDIRTIPYENKFFSVSHSSGVLEHYSDEEIVNLINEQLRVSDYCVFSVPTKYFEKKMLGNERFLSRKEWKNIISKSNAKIIKESGYHYKTLKYRLLDIIKKPNRIFKPVALYLFVLKERELNDLYSKTWANRLEC